MDLGFCACCGSDAGDSAITIKPRDTERTVCGNCAQLVLRVTAGQGS